MKIPAYLKKGDTVGITCPAGYMEAAKAATCIATLQQWGFEVMVGKTLGSNSDNYFSGTDEQRLDEFQAMLDDDSINAILCGRGGYGVTRIIDKLDFTRFKKKPKWIIGFSDITVFHTHINSNLKISTLHAPMAAAFNDGGDKDEYVQSLRKVLTGKKASYKCAGSTFNKMGAASGELIGGNLALLAHVCGTKSDINTKNKILFIEDIGEYTYNVDRMLYQLKRSGKLDKLKALIVGGFTDMKDTTRPFGKTVYEVIAEMVAEYDYPVCFDFPVGHQNENYALKVGGEYILKVDKKRSSLTEV